MSEPLNSPQRLLHLRIEKAIYGGAGLARSDGKAIFTPFTLPGELVTASVTFSKPAFAEAKLEAVLEASPTRAVAPCPYFGVCGGCHYQHATYQAQLAMKASILEETLARARLTMLPEIVTHAGEPFGYRTRIRLHVDPATSALGYRERSSHRLLGVSQCPIAAPELEQALHALTQISEAQGCGRFFSQAELSISHDGSQLLLALWMGQGVRVTGSAQLEEAQRRLSQVCESLHRVLPALCGAGVHAAVPLASSQSDSQKRYKAGRRSRPSMARREQNVGLEKESGLVEDRPGALIATWTPSGVGHRVTPQLNYLVGDLDYRVSLGAFFQVNRALIARLVQLATGDRSGGLAWDLYAGVGLFSRVLAQHFDQVVAVEGAPVSYEDLRFHLAGPHQAVHSSTLDFLRRAAAGMRTQERDIKKHTAVERGRPEFVLVDPPRAGLGEEVTRLLAQIGPLDITYVSCDPATLSRDLRALVDSGYKLQQLHLIDLFPQTFHLETVVMLSRR